MEKVAFSFLKVSSLIPAFTVSVLLHGLVLSLQFVPSTPPASSSKALDVILVNSRSAQKPTDAQALAQTNLDGGGNVDQDRRATTPLPPTRKNQSGQELEQVQRQVRELERERQILQAKTEKASTHRRVETIDPLPQNNPINGMDLAESARAMARLEGEIARDTDEYNKRPRKKFVGARTSEYRFAQYIENWRQKVERIGTMNYPEAAKGRLYGALTMSVTIGRDGTVLNINIDRSSGHKILDDAARRIVQLSSPFAPFPPAISTDTDQLVITRTWTFTNHDSLETK